MKHLSWKYIAGFMDGEGCISLKPCAHKDYPDKVYFRISVTIAQAVPGKQVIDLLQNNFGGYVHHRVVDNPKWQDSYSWCIASKSSIRKFLQNIVNHLIIKKEQAKLMIWFIDNMYGKHLSQEVKDCISNEFKIMKRDSQRLSDRAVEDLKKKFPEDFD